jgi:tRNA U34 2-thiouridine synthase MnmA/TrmU
MVSALKGKALALISGGLDSTLAVRMVKEMGLQVEAVHFTTPFCQCDKCSVDTTAERLDIKVHHIFLGEEFLKVVADPPHGWGSQMNVCIDCRILMLRRAKTLAEEIGAGFFVTGEVLGQRPMSQHSSAMRLIEREAGVESLVLRPLSGKLMKQTQMEDEGIVDRGRLLDISGRRRLPQFELAEKLGVYDYPCPSGGCLLTDPEFAMRIRDYLENEGPPTIEAILLLKVGRHFRVGSTRVVVGRNELENNILEGFARRGGTRLEVEGISGPVTLALGCDEAAVNAGAKLTVRYSDAPRGDLSWVKVTSADSERRIQAEAADDDTLESMRIKGTKSRNKKAIG